VGARRAERSSGSGDFSMGGSDVTGAVEIHETLGAAAALMIDEELSCLVTVESGLPRGLVTERELVRGVLCEHLDPTDRLDSIPWRPMVSATEGTRAADVVFLMESHALRHVPVADEQGSIVGMFAFEDALALVLEEITALAVRVARSASASQRSVLALHRPILEAKDVQTLVAFVDAGASARDVAMRLRTNAAEMLVVREGARTLGLVTERDLLRTLESGANGPESVCAGDLVSPLVSVTPDEPLMGILAHMADQEIRSIGVTGPDGSCSGIVSLGNLLVSLTVEMAARVELSAR
jgi:CBS domain-containing protein